MRPCLVTVTARSSQEKKQVTCEDMHAGRQGQSRSEAIQKDGPEKLLGRRVQVGEVMNQAGEDREPGVRGQAGGAVSPKKLESETILALP